MRRLKTIIPVAGILLLILSAASLYVAMQALSDIRPAEDYEDIGVLTFQPYDVLPVQVKNTRASSRDRRMNPTKTVYMVYYRATDGSGYEWSEEAYSKDHDQRAVEAGEDSYFTPNSPVPSGEQDAGSGEIILEQDFCG